MNRNPDIMFLTEYLKNVLCFATVRLGKTLKSTSDTHYFCIDNDLVYENYYSDFGPLNLGCVYKYCVLLNDKVKQYLNKQIIVHYTSIDPKKKANAAFLIGCYGVLYLNLTPKDALKPLLLNGQTYRPFQDATQGDSTYTISLYDCLLAIKKARDLGLFNFNDFNYEEYDRLDKIHGGDLNWIVPGKFLAFIGPEDYSVSLYHPPEMYIDYFLESSVKIVIRLNKRLYDGNTFTNVGIVHYDLFFADGSCPPRHILLKFLQISEESDGAIAVHCKAGLGRTGSLIGCYLIKHYRMTSHEAIGWMRICRPGSVIGHQQTWLEQLEPWLIKQGNLYRKRNFNDTERMPVHHFGVYSILEKSKGPRTVSVQKSLSPERRVFRNETSPVKIQSLPNKTPGTPSKPTNDKLDNEEEEIFLTSCDLTVQPATALTQLKGCVIRTNAISEDDGEVVETRQTGYKDFVRKIKDCMWVISVRCAKVAPRNCYSIKFCAVIDMVAVYKAEKEQYDWRMKSPKMKVEKMMTNKGDRNFKSVKPPGTTSNFTTVTSNRSQNMTNPSLRCGAGEPRLSRTMPKNTHQPWSPARPSVLQTQTPKDKPITGYQPMITTFRSTNGPSIKNVNEAKNYLLRSSMYSDERDRLLKNSITVTSPTPGRLSQYYNNYVGNAGQSTPSSYASSKASSQNQQRRRLGRSPSPPPTMRTSNERTRATNTPAVMAHEFKRKETTSILDALSRLKLSKERDGSVGAGSLGARREAPAARHLAPSVRSDERPLATQGDMLNSIKFQRRLRETLLSDELYNEKLKNMPPSDKNANSKISMSTRVVRQDFVPRIQPPRSPMSSIQVTRNLTSRPASPKGKRSPHVQSFF